MLTDCSLNSWAVILNSLSVLPGKSVFSSLFMLSQLFHTLPLLLNPLPISPLSLCLAENLAS